jgi:hypothetical protein
MFFARDFSLFAEQATFEGSSRVRSASRFILSIE